MPKKKNIKLVDVIMRSYYLQFNKVQFLQCDLGGPIKTLIHDKIRMGIQIICRPKWANAHLKKKI